MVKVFPFNLLVATNSNAIEKRNIKNTDKRFDSKARALKNLERGKAPIVVVSSESSLCSELGVNINTVEKFIDCGVLESALSPSFLVYSQCVGHHTQTAVCVALSIDDCFNGVLKRHEKTIKLGEAGFDADSYLDNNVDPIMIMYRDDSAINTLVARIIATTLPVIQRFTKSTLSAQSTHTVWKVDAEEDVNALKTAFETVETLYIADGHHRTAFACRRVILVKRFEKLLDFTRYFFSVRLASEPNHTLQINWQSRYLTGLLFPQSHLRVWPFARCVKSLGGITSDLFLSKIAANFHVEVRHDLNENKKSTPEQSPQTRHFICKCSLNSSTSNTSHVLSKSPQQNWFAKLPFLWGTSSYFGLKRTKGVHRNERSTYQPFRIVSEKEIDTDRESNSGSENSINICCSCDCMNSGCSSDRVAHRNALEPKFSQNVIMCLAGRWYELSPRSRIDVSCPSDNPLGDLGVQILLDKLLNPILGEESPINCRMHYVCGNDTDEMALKRMVDNGEVSVAFCVSKISIEDVMKVADAGQLLPPKATCFEPKPLSCMFKRLY